jgi:hypothetical protein
MQATSVNPTNSRQVGQPHINLNSTSGGSGFQNFEVMPARHPVKGIKDVAVAQQSTAMQGKDLERPAKKGPGEETM